MRELPGQVWRKGGAVASVRIAAGAVSASLSVFSAVAAGGGVHAQLPPLLQSESEELENYKRLSLADLMELEVTSVSRRPEKLAEAAAAIQVVTNEELRRSGATTLPQALRGVDNLNVAQKNAHDWGVSSRGFNTALSNKLFVALDGRTVYTPLFSGVFWSAQDRLLEDVDRIEVVSGPGGSTWGANAVNGVINVVSKPAGATQGTYVETTFGPRRSGAGVRYGGTIGAAGHYRLWGKYTDYGEERRFSGAGAGDEWHHAVGGFRVDLESGADRWVVQGDSYSGEEGVLTGGRTRQRGANVLTRWSRVLGDESDLTVQVYVDRTRFTLPVPAFLLGALPLAPAGELRESQDTFDFDLQHGTRVARHGLTWGVGFRHVESDVESAPALAFRPEDRTLALWSGFVQDEVRLGPSSELTLGTKLEHNEYTGLEWSPTVRWTWHPGPSRTWWAAVSRAVRMPSRIDRDLAQPGGPVVVLRGDDGFESETVVALEAGYRATWGERVGLSIAVFHNDYDELRSTNFTPNTILPFFFANDLQGRTSGIEARARIEVAPSWRLRIGYAFLEEDLEVRAGAFDLNAARNETADPAHQVALRSSWDLRNRNAVDAALRWVDSVTINAGAAVAQVPSYTELDLRWSFQLTPNLEVSLVGENVLDAAHPEYGPPGADRVEIRRTFFGKLAWRP
jgi:iron complex outermembrane receptor protein